MTFNILKGGKGDNSSLSNFNPKEVELGLKVEREHTSNLAIIKEIVADHLSEDPNYYTKLNKAKLVDENYNKFIFYLVEQLLQENYEPEWKKFNYDQLLDYAASVENEDELQTILTHAATLEKPTNVEEKPTSAKKKPQTAAKLAVSKEKKQPTSKYIPVDAWREADPIHSFPNATDAGYDLSIEKYSKLAETKPKTKVKKEKPVEPNHYGDLTPEEKQYVKSGFLSKLSPDRIKQLSRKALEAAQTAEKLRAEFAAKVGKIGMRGVMRELKTDIDGIVQTLASVKGTTLKTASEVLRYKPKKEVVSPFVLDTTPAIKTDTPDPVQSFTSHIAATIAKAKQGNFAARAELRRLHSLVNGVVKHNKKGEVVHNQISRNDPVFNVTIHDPVALQKLSTTRSFIDAANIWTKSNTTKSKK